jgi:cell division protein FtsQ
VTTTTREGRAADEVEAGSPPIDPRFRARRVAVKRSAGRRRLRWVVAFGVVVAVLVLAASLFFTPLLDVDRITVAGQFRTAPEDIVAAGGVDRGEPLARIDLEAAARRVEELPWVAEATVVRDWPGTVRYRITERTPVAGEEGPDGTWAAVDGGGRVVAELDDAPADLPVVQGATVAVEVGATASADERGAFALAAAIPPSTRPLVAAVVVGADRAVTVRLVAGGVVTVGPLEDLPEKGAALAGVLAAVDPCVVTLDLTVAAAPLLTRTPGCG